MYRPTTRTSEKCIACFPRLEGKDAEISPTGAPAETRCMSACVGKIRLQGLVKIEEGAWAKDPENPLYYLVRERQVALPLYPQFGTEPNGFYIPPRWVPRGYLTQMFGPGVDHAIEQYSCPDRELLAVLQLFRAERQIIFKFQIEKGNKIGEIEVTMPNGSTKTQELFNDTAIGFNKFGEEVVRVTVEEPTFEMRPQLTSIRYRKVGRMRKPIQATEASMKSMTSYEVDFDPAVNLARQSLYRIAAWSLLDPRVGSWDRLNQLRDDPLPLEAAALIREMPEARPAKLGIGELPLKDLDPRPLFEYLPTSRSQCNTAFEQTFGLLVSATCPPYEME
jgi:hypothetical protein